MDNIEYSVFTVYERTTGKIITSGYADSSSIQTYLNEDRDVVFDSIDTSKFYLPQGVKTPFPEKPNTTYHVFDYTIGQWIDPRTSEGQWISIREERNLKLQNSDWTQLPDVPLATKEAWANYRQQLRDVTSQSDPFNIVWPTPPA